MASGVNKVILLGNLGKDPVIRPTSSGAPMASFSLATSETWIDKTTKQRREKTEWHNVVVFNKGLIKIIEKHLHKGTKVYIEGSFQNRTWTDQNGEKRNTTEIVLQGFNCTLTILEKKSNGSFGGGYDDGESSSSQHSGGDSSYSHTSSEFNSKEHEDEEDSIPF